MNKVIRFGSIFAAAGIVSVAAACSSGGGSSDGSAPVPSYTDPVQGTDAAVCLLVNADQSFGAATAAQVEALVPQMSNNMRGYVLNALQDYKDLQPAGIEAFRQQVVPMPGSDPKAYTDEKVAARIAQTQQDLVNQVNNIVQYCKYQ